MFPPMRLLALFATTALFIGACSSAMSLGEYAEEGERLIETMNRRIDDGEAALVTDPSLERARSYATDRVQARNDFLDAFVALDPPEEIAEFHAAALDILTRLATAEAALAELVMEADSFEEASSVWTSREGEAVRQIDEEALAICAAAQESLDSTKDRETFSDSPWIPPELKEIVDVTFRCDGDES